MINGVVVFIIIFVIAGLILFFGLVPSLRDTGFLRSFPAFKRLRKELGTAVEKGARVHVSLGKSGLIQSTNTSALIGLTTLEQVSLYSSNSDRPPVATSGDGGLAILSQDTERASFLEQRHGALQPIRIFSGQLLFVYCRRAASG